ncbi:MAG: type I-U CRISPR-associated protein Cas5/Cas6 [Bryobacterales bacterium]|nr:type I-U CRISPR-associated protein Cas5/Cas6 [Bryobacterales bacterium]MBV9396416.1 type I-U CRISPR-associated protein Cas5/Cas6 [Bryobacterales bacterium]
MFGFRITYLRGSVTAADIRRGNEKDAIEWPPHPDRLFSALIQAWGDLDEPERGRVALRWLEKVCEESAPLIRCGEVLSMNALQRYFPVNDNWDPIVKGKITPPIAGTLIGRDRKPRRIPAATLSDEVVVFWWPSIEPSRDDHSSLTELAHAVASVGHPSCLVAVDVIANGADLAPNLVPRPDGSVTLRIPTPGRLASLNEAYKAKRRPGIGAWASYGSPAEDNLIPRGHHGDLIVFRLSGDRASLPLEATPKLIAGWRRAVLEKADQPPTEVISGHSSDSTENAPKPSKRSHLALLPLPDVGHRFARSHLLGVAAALPDDLAPEERRACLRALGRVECLKLGDLGVWKLERCNTSESRNGLKPETWADAASVWSTVTPVVFGRYPKDLWGHEAVSMICEACRIAGLPALCDVTVAPVAWILGVPPSGRFAPLPSRPGKPKRAHAHVRLVFSRKVAGPVLVGAGRHQGYGLFRQLEEGGA